MEKPKLVVAFSGGKTSAFMAYKIKNSEKYKDWEVIYVFANTGKENPETLQFADDVDKFLNLNLVWVEAVTDPRPKHGVKARVVNFKTASRNGEPFEAMIAKHGIPNVNTPFCTRELKTYAINAYLRSIGWKTNEYRAIGIRIDEVDRVNPSYQKDKIIYPLISDFPTTREEVNYFWASQTFSLNLKGYEGNCDLCYKKSLRKLLTITSETPQKVKWWLSMEQKYESYIPATRKNQKAKPPLRFFRKSLSCEDLFEMSLDFIDYATDDSFDFPQGKMLRGVDIDQLDGCSESCEAY